MAEIVQILRFPVKGLSGQELDSVEVSPAGGMPLDRMFAIARGSAMAGGKAIADLGWKDCLQLKNCPKLASLSAEFDADETLLTLKRQGRQVARGNLSQPVGRQLIEQFLSAFLADEINSPPKIVSEEGQIFSDARAPKLSIINLETLRDIERVLRRPLEPRRFRGNFYIDGLPPWAEFDWIGSELDAGGARLRITQRIDRCAATNVDPDTGESDMQIPKVLQSGFGHMDCGVFAEVLSAGSIRRGDAIG
ncbi:MAG: hypothetical protein TEF_02685 [Rhizobiales bacterium NRL2]|nr:MAG: hypothetical protein TEF_02685 [Rhizobiales bacterium NRL2]